MLASVLAVLGCVDQAHADAGLLDLLRQPQYSGEPRPKSDDACQGATETPLGVSGSNSQLTIEIGSYCLLAQSTTGSDLVLAVKGKLRNDSPDRAMSLTAPAELFVLQLSGGGLAMPAELGTAFAQSFAARPLQPLDQREFVVGYRVPEPLPSALLVLPAAAGLLAFPIIPMPPPVPNPIATTQWHGLTVTAESVTTRSAQFSGDSRGRHLAALSLRIENNSDAPQQLRLADFAEALATSNGPAELSISNSTLSDEATFFTGVPVVGTLSFWLDDDVALARLVLEGDGQDAELSLASTEGPKTLPAPGCAVPTGPLATTSEICHRSYAAFTDRARNVLHPSYEIASITGGSNIGALVDGSLADDPWVTVPADEPLTLTLSSPVPAEGLRLKLWNGDERISSLLIEGANQRGAFAPLADLRDPGIRDVVDLDLGGRMLGAIRISGRVTNNDDPALYPTELELWTKAPPPKSAAGPHVELVRHGLAQGDPVTVAWRGLPWGPDNQLAIAAAGSADGERLRSFATDGSPTGRRVLDTLPPGDYELRAFYPSPVNGPVAERVPFNVGSHLSGAVGPAQATSEPVDVAMARYGALPDAGERGGYLIDGNTEDYDDDEGFAVLDNDHANRIWLAHPYPIQAVTLRLWDGDDRLYHYALEASTDGVRWQALAQRAVPGGTQRIELDGNTYIGFRLTNLSVDGSEDGQFRVVEFSAYAEAANAGVVAMPEFPSSPADWAERPNPALNIALPAFGTIPFANTYAENLADGTPAAAQASLDGGELGLTFDRPYRLERLMIHLADRNGEAFRFRVEGAIEDDDDAWILVSDQTAAAVTGDLTINFGGTPAIRRVRLSPVQGTGPAGATLEVAELEAYTSDPLPLSALARALPESEFPRPFARPDAAAGRNLALATAGGRIVSVTSSTAAVANFGETSGSEGYLNDGISETAWRPVRTDPDPTIVVDLPGDRPALISDIELYLFNWSRPRLVDIWALAEDGAWQNIGRFGLNGGSRRQQLPVPPTQATALRVSFPDRAPDTDLDIAELIVHEGSKPGYQSVMSYTRPGFAGGLNIAASWLGGRIAAAGPLMDEDPIALIDGNVLGWGFHTTDQDNSVPYATLALPGDRPATIGGVAISPQAGIATFTTDANWANLVDLWVSTESAESGFSWVGRYRFDHAAETRIFSFTPRPARFVRVVALGTNGTPFSPLHMGLGEVQVLEEPSGASVAATPNLVDFRYGGHVVVPAGQRRTDLIDSTTATPGWRDATGLRPVTFTLGFANSEPRKIDAIGINPKTELPAEAWTTRVKLLVSDSPAHDFQSVGELVVSPEDKLKWLEFPPVEARFVQLRLIANGGATEMALGDVFVRESVPSGAMSSVAVHVGLAEPPTIAAETTPPPLEAPLSEQEPNDTLASANPLPEAQWLKAQIAPLTDHDWYALAAKGAVTLQLDERTQPQVGLALTDGAHDGMPIPLATDGGHSSASLLVDGAASIDVMRPQNSIVVIIDRSGSVTPVRPAIAAAAQAFAESALPDEAISFASMDGEIFNDFSTDKAVLREAARKTAEGSGGSLVYGSIAESINRLNARPGRHAVIIVTDGEDSGSSDDPLFSLWSLLSGTDTRVYTIGYGDAAVGQLPDLGSTGGDMLRNFSIATGGRYYLAPDGAAMAAIYERIAADLRGDNAYRISAASSAKGTLRLEAAKGRIKGVSAPPRIIFIFDASGSMAAKTETGQTRMEAATEVLRNIIGGLPDGTEVALRVYGHRFPKDPKGESCADTELVVPFGPLDRPGIDAVVSGLVPRGQTPLGLSLSQLASDFAGAPGRKIAILITDGIESCATEPNDPNYPPAVVEALRKQDIDLKVNVVSLDIPSGDSATRDLLKSIATAGSGQYFDTGGAAELSAALAESFRIGFTVTDALGQTVLDGKIGDPPAPLPAGHWRITIDTDPPRDLGLFEVKPDAPTTIALEPEGDGYTPIVAAP